MKMRIEKGKPLNLNDQINAIDKGILPAPECTQWQTPTVEDASRKGSLEGWLEYINDGKTTQCRLRNQIHFPTPRANSGTGACIHGQGMDLQTAVKLFSTPTVQDYKHRGPNSNQQGLADVVRTWATPTANDAKNSISESQIGRGTLTAHLAEREGIGGQLSADWVEVLMGYPHGWTDLKKDKLIFLNFPVAWLDGSWENGIPRIVKRQRKRVTRLKGLGNSVVPLIPMLIWLLIKDRLHGVHE
jgi:hypothetical protein